ncbi:MAG: putative Multi-sensor signal transduction histidine kinase [Candidatus Saccharibacteria bacterium]|nr:putative Multi-sensor signal transduction histidine kinase [Candidatus Saccharibacteria bacterium]
MEFGGITTSKKSQRIMRWSGLLIPVVLTLYGLLIMYKVVPSTFYTSDIIFFSLMAGWMLLGAFQFLFYVKSQRSAAIRLISYYLLGAAYLLLISGFTMPFIGCWVLLLLATYAFFADSGLRLNLMALVAIAAADIIIHVERSEVIVNDIMAVLSIIIVGMATIALTKAQQTDSAMLEKSKKQEVLQRDSILTLVNNLADAVLSTDKNGKIEVYNAASLGLLDTNESLGGKHIDEVMTLYNEDSKVVRFIDLLKDSRGVSIADSLTMTIGGEEVRLELTYSPIRSSFSRSKKANSEDGYIIILRDITKSKSLEEERDEFISVVSHELRTPITIAEGTISNAQLMFDRDDIHDDLLRAGLETAHEQIVFLAKMVNDLSTLSRAERGVADAAEDIDVKELVEGLYNEYAPEAKKKGLKLDLDAAAKLGTVTASRLYLHELLQNFITNAIKYTKEGKVTLSVSTNTQTVHFLVKDTGIGISKADQDKIFKKFYRSEDYRTRETGGTGLGLYVATKLAKKLGCTIEMTSRLNHGSSFGIRLPLKK